MVVLSGQPSEQLRILNEAIEEALGMNKAERKEFKPKIILGKVRKEKWIELEDKPVIDEKVHIIIPVDFVSVMESKGGGAEYISLEDCPLA
jgi:2'-5' RNA ligase